MSSSKSVFRRREKGDFSTVEMKGFERRRFKYSQTAKLDIFDESTSPENESIASIFSNEIILSQSNCFSVFDWHQNTKESVDYSSLLRELHSEEIAKNDAKSQ